MKRALKRLLPILLGIVVILSLLWYLFIYDPGFTQDMLLKHARYFDSKGNYGIATWLYDQAYRQSGNDDQVAIELAQQYKSHGNYTKAEYTLSNAIADGGSVDLYIALCKTYVEQDKLLDAVTMLDNIMDPNIRAQLSELRPAAPLVTPDPGFYSQYLTISVTADVDRLLLSTDGSYPSVKTDLSNGNHTLVSGENTIYALCIADNGLVSPLSMFGYTVGGVVEAVTLENPVLEQMVRQQLELLAGEPLYSNLLWDIKTLTLSQDAVSGKDLAWFTKLESLTIQGSNEENLDFFANFKNLKELFLVDCMVSQKDLETIAALPSLERLALVSCNISNISALSEAKRLSYLDLKDNAIRDVIPLSFSTGLVHLDLSHNILTNLNALSSLTALEYLDVSYNLLTSVTPLSSCTALSALNISNNEITSLSGMDSLSLLKSLKAGFNRISEVDELVSCTGLTDLNLSNNTLTDISKLSALEKLEYFDFSHNQVSAIPIWKQDCALITIDGSYNQITTVGTLTGLANLNYVLMDNNQITSVNSLVDCPYLIKVSVFDNPVDDVSELLKISVIVNYNPIA
jgi:Leucine-rich repeat (LRR) protein